MAYRMTDGAEVLRLADGAIIPDDPSNADRQAFDAWVAEGGQVEPPATGPASPRLLPPLEFRDRFTPAEEVAITEAAMAAAPLRVWLDRLNAATYVDLDEPRTVEGLTVLESAGLLAPGRREAILASTSPGE